MVMPSQFWTLSLAPLYSFLSSPLAAAAAASSTPGPPKPSWPVTALSKTERRLAPGSLETEARCSTEEPKANPLEAAPPLQEEVDEVDAVVYLAAISDLTIAKVSRTSPW